MGSSARDSWTASPRESPTPSCENEGRREEATQCGSPAVFQILRRSSGTWTWEGPPRSPPSASVLFLLKAVCCQRQTQLQTAGGAPAAAAGREARGGAAMASAEDPEEARLEEVTQRLLAATAACTQQGDAVRALKAELKAQRASKVGAPYHPTTPRPPAATPRGGSRGPSPTQTGPASPFPLPLPLPLRPRGRTAAPGTLRALTHPPATSRQTWPRRSRS